MTDMAKRPKKWLPDDLSGVRISLGGELLALIEANGNVRLRPDTAPDEVALAFWQAVNASHPFRDDYARLAGATREQAKEIARLRALLKENGIDYRTGGPEATVSSTSPARDPADSSGRPEAPGDPGGFLGGSPEDRGTGG